jgi:hypothetical protein
MQLGRRERTGEKERKRGNKQKKEKREEYLEDIADLEKKNTEMKNKLNGYKDNGSEKWKIFKMEFSKEMDDLGKSIKDLTTKDKD